MTGIVVRTHLDIHMFNTHMYHLVEAVALYVLLIALLLFLKLI